MTSAAFRNSLEEIFGAPRGSLKDSDTRDTVEGWTSLFIVTCLFEGLVLVSLGVIAEYLGVAVSMAMGKPPYLIVSRPTQNPTHKQ